MNHLKRICLLVSVVLGCNSSKFTSSASGGSSSAPQQAPGSQQDAGAAKKSAPGSVASFADSASQSSMGTPVGAPGGLKVTVVDATNNSPIPGAQVSLDASKKSAVTDASGVVNLNYSAADALISSTAKGYSDAAEQINPKAAAMILFMSPPLDATQARLVLSWGETPADLDGHLYIQPTGGKNYHIWYLNKKTPYGSQDYDSKNGFGPETITVNSLVPGHYVYRVSDYYDCGLPGDGSNLVMSRDSNAVVTVYLSGSARTYAIPKGQVGRVWSVLSFDVDANHMVHVNVANQFGDNCIDYQY